MEILNLVCFNVVLIIKIFETRFERGFYSHIFSRILAELALRKSREKPN